MSFVGVPGPKNIVGWQWHRLGRPSVHVNTLLLPHLVLTYLLTTYLRSLGSYIAVQRLSEVFFRYFLVLVLD